ncbi:MAG TPA: TlpA disulfide reductase family protein [Burkholderiales bacterium]|jgi:peroxiredoxin|nr:TlpA disulfide reductase family protein [Burkholderiales bacterium]
MAVAHEMLRAVAVAAAFVGFAFGAAAAGPVQVDASAPELDFRLANGKLVKARDLHGKVVVTMIWATWSPAARMQLGDLQRLYAGSRGKGLEVLALSIDESIGEVREFWRARGYTMPVAMRSDAFFEHYGRVTTTPMYYIVDRHGMLRHRIAGTLAPEKLEALVTPLVAEPAPSERFAAQR